MTPCVQSDCWLVSQNRICAVAWSLILKTKPKISQNFREARSVCTSKRFWYFYKNGDSQLQFYFQLILQRKHMLASRNVSLISYFVVYPDLHTESMGCKGHGWRVSCVRDAVGVCDLRQNCGNASKLPNLSFGFLISSVLVGNLDPCDQWGLQGCAVPLVGRSGRSGFPFRSSGRPKTLKTHVIFCHNELRRILG